MRKQQWGNHQRKLQNSGKFQNNAVKDVKQISLSHMIKGYSNLFINVLACKVVKSNAS